MGVASWRRTRRLRRGEVGTDPPQPGGGRTSRTTFLAGGAGLSVLAVALVRIGRQPALGTALLCAWGAVIAGTGFARRVTAVDADGAGLMVRFATGRTFRTRWDQIRSLRPPSTPLGGWRVDGAARAVTLMPSDALGHEAVLETAVRRAGLRFDGRCWSQEGGRRGTVAEPAAARSASRRRSNRTVSS